MSSDGPPLAFFTPVIIAATVFIIIMICAFLRRNRARNGTLLRTPVAVTSTSHVPVQTGSIEQGTPYSVQNYQTAQPSQPPYPVHSYSPGPAAGVAYPSAPYNVYPPQYGGHTLPQNSAVQPPPYTNYVTTSSQPYQQKSSEYNPTF